MLLSSFEFDRPCERQNVLSCFDKFINMKITFRYFILLSLILFLGSCFEYETQFEGTYDDEEGNQPQSLKVLVFAAGGDVYLSDPAIQKIEKIDSIGNVELASINNAHTKVAFKRGGGDIQIYDIATGTIIDEVPSSNNANWFDFHKNNETVYFLTGWKMDTYGPDVMVSKPIDLEVINTKGGSIKGAVVLENGNIIFSVQGDLASYIIQTDGIIEIDADLALGPYRKHLRLNKVEDTFWGATTQNRVYVHNFTETILSSHYSNASFGAPTAITVGYIVSPAIGGGDDIYLPSSSTAVSIPTNAKITSIDH